MTIRVLHFIDTLGAGGAERQLVYLLENLNRQRFEPHVVTTYDTFRHFEANLRQLGVPIYSLHHGPLNASNRLQALVRYVRLMSWLRPELVHCWLHYPNLLARAARPICPPHRLITAIRTEYSPRQRLIERLTAKLSDFRIVNYKYRDTQLPLPAPNPPIYIPNTVSQDFLTPHIPTSHNYPPTVLIVARIDPQKGHLTALKAIHNLNKTPAPNFRVLFIGHINDTHLQRQIEQTIKAYSLQNIVEQLPPCHDIVSHYHNALVTLIPSTSEGSSNVMLESLATGTPVITSEAANHIGLIQEGHNGRIFPTNDSTALAHCLKTALELAPEEYYQMTIRCRETATPFTTIQMVSQYEALYTRALTPS